MAKLRCPLSSDAAPKSNPGFDKPLNSDDASGTRSQVSLAVIAALELEGIRSEGVWNNRRLCSPD